MGNKSSSPAKKEPEKPSSSSPPASSSPSSPPSSSPSSPDASHPPLSLDEDTVSLAASSSSPPPFADGSLSTDAEASYSFFNRGNKTIVPQKGATTEKQKKLNDTMKATLKATLGTSGDIKEAVKLPPGEDKDEWLAMNTISFFNAAVLIFSTVSPFCTDASCPVMGAGRAEYLWKDGKEYKKATRVSAPVYIGLMFEQMEKEINDPKVFPVKEGQRFPRNFSSIVKTIMKRLFRLYGHLYHSHSEKIRSIGANSHLNTCFKHFFYFVEEFNLIEKEDLQPLQKLIDKLKEQEAERKNNNEGGGGK